MIEQEFNINQLGKVMNILPDYWVMTIDMGWMYKIGNESFYVGRFYCLI